MSQFNGQFSISQGSDVTSLTLEDTSTGSDTNLTDRRIYLIKSDGTTLVPQGSSTTYIDWPLTDGNSIALTGILAQDWCLNIQVIWTSSSPLPSPSSYTFNILQAFTDNLILFAYGLSELQSGNPFLVTDNDYFSNKSKLWVLIDDAQN